MQQRSGQFLTALALVLVAAAIAVPVALSILLAQQQARASQAHRALFYAADVLRRAETSGDQINRAFAALARIPEAEDCSPAAIAELQKIDATSPNVQFVGVVRGNRLVCSSYGIHNPPLDLHEPDHTWVNGHGIRQQVSFPFAPGRRFIVIDNGRFAAVLDKALQVDAPTIDPGVSLGLASSVQGGLFATRGDFDPRWVPALDALKPGESRTGLIGHHMVARIRSKTLDAVAIAAMNEQSYSGSELKFIRVLLPIGVILGLLLGWVILRIARSQTSLPAAIRSGLRNHEFFVVFQPIVRLADERWVGAEALIRWDRGGKVMRPDLFIQAAEETSLICAITARLVELVEPVLADLAVAHEDFFISINLSAQDLHATQTITLLKGLLERTRARPSQLHVEITERGFADTVAAHRMIRHLRELGIAVSIDDFGTGYSSLSELVNFELDAIKIDKAFIDTIGSDAVTNQIAHLIVGMAGELKLTTIAEGIEHAVQLEILKTWGVEYGQGWHFSEALPANELRESLAIPAGQPTAKVAATGRP